MILVHDIAEVNENIYSPFHTHRVEGCESYIASYWVAALCPRAAFELIAYSVVACRTRLRDFERICGLWHAPLSGGSAGNFGLPKFCDSPSFVGNQFTTVK